MVEIQRQLWKADGDNGFQKDSIRTDSNPSAPFIVGSETSKQSAMEIKSGLGPLQWRVYGFLVGRYGRGATDEEMQIALSMNPSTQRPRRVELVAKGLIEKHGTRKTKAGRNATVWRAK